MRHGFISVAAGSPPTRKADCRYHAEQAAQLMAEAAGAGVQVLALPALYLTGTSVDFHQYPLLDAAVEALLWLAESSKGTDMLTFVGLPLPMDGKLYACAAGIQNGVVRGVVPQRFLCAEALRFFAPAPAAATMLNLEGVQTPFGRNVLFVCETAPALSIGVELDEDFWAPVPPHTFSATAGATVLVGLSNPGKDLGVTQAAAAAQSRRLHSAYVQSGRNLIFEDGVLLAQSPVLARTEIDTERLEACRRRNHLFQSSGGESFLRIGFTLAPRDIPLTRPVSRQADDEKGEGTPHDFFYAYSSRWGFPPSKLLRLAELAFPELDRETLLHELTLFLELTMPGSAHIWKAELNYLS